MKPLSLILVLAVAGMGLSACGGGRTNQTTTVKTTTTGQELEDLQRAYQNGAITEKEFEKKRAQILKGS